MKQFPALHSLCTEEDQRKLSSEQTSLAGMFAASREEVEAEESEGLEMDSHPFAALAQELPGLDS
jgi:hypothetical protein